MYICTHACDYEYPISFLTVLDLKALDTCYKLKSISHINCNLL